LFYLPYDEASKVHQYSSVMVLTPLLVGMLEVQILPLLQELYSCSIGGGRGRDRDTGRDTGRRRGVRKFTIAVTVGVSLVGLMYQPRCLSMGIDALRLVSLSVVRYSMLMLSLRASNRSSRINNDVDDDVRGLADGTSIDSDSDGDQSSSSVTTTTTTASQQWTYPLVSFYGHMVCIICHLMRKVL